MSCTYSLKVLTKATDDAMEPQVDGGYVLQECTRSSSIDPEPLRVVSETFQLLANEMSKLEKKNKLTTEDESELAYINLAREFHVRLLNLRYNRTCRKGQQRQMQARRFS